MINNKYLKYIKYKIKYLNLGGMDNDNNDIFTINLTSGETFNIDASDIIYIKDLIELVATYLNVYPMQISLVEGDEIISDDPELLIFDINHTLTCIIKPPPTLYVYYDFVTELGCSGECGIGSLYISLEKPSPLYDHCEVLESNMFLYYEKIENLGYTCCTGFIRYENFYVGIISEESYNPYDNPNYKWHEHDVTIDTYVLNYGDALKMLDNPNGQVKDK